MNVKVMKRLIDTEKEGPFAEAIALVADDGLTALEVLRNELNAGRQIHFILMDYIMVLFLCLSSTQYLNWAIKGYYEWSGRCSHHATGSLVQRRYYWSFL